MKGEKIIHLQQASPGMILSRDVVDPGGYCLMTAGITLTAVHLQGLLRRGINSITVECEQESSDEAVAAEQQACIAALERRFRQLQDDPHMQRLKQLLLDYRLGTMDKDSSG